MLVSKSSIVESKQLEQKQLDVLADLVLPKSDAPSLVTFSGVLATRTIEIDLKQPVASCQSVQIINRSNGQSVALLSGPVISGDKISVSVNGTGLSDVCIKVSYKSK